jgi:phosphopantetheinyl transferase
MGRMSDHNFSTIPRVSSRVPTPPASLQPGGSGLLDGHIANWPASFATTLNVSSSGSIPIPPFHTLLRQRCEASSWDVLRPLAGSGLDVWLISLSDDLPSFASSHLEVPLVSSDGPSDTARRQRLTQSRQFCRMILSWYLGCEPSMVSIKRHSCGTCGNQHGKPYLVPPPSRTDSWTPISFSLSRSADKLGLAVCSAGEVGVDLEVNESGAILASAYAVAFSREEIRAYRLDERDSPHQDAVFLWTLKEATLKCLGTGLALDPRMVSFIPQDCLASSAARESWTLCSLAFESCRTTVISRSAASSVRWPCIRSAEGPASLCLDELVSVAQPISIDRDLIRLGTFR